MTYRAWELKNLDRAALRELTAAIAEQAAEELEYNAQEGEPWSEQKYKAVLAAQQKENALRAGVLTARGVTDPTDALTLLAGEEELSDPFLLTDMQKAVLKQTIRPVTMEGITPPASVGTARHSTLLRIADIPKPPSISKGFT